MTLTELAEAILAERELGAPDATLLPALAELALVARRAGVHPTLEDLVDPLERKAWAAAGDRFEVTRAQRIGQAATGPRGVLLVEAELDQGDAHDEAVIATACESLAVRFRDEAPCG